MFYTLPGASHVMDNFMALNKPRVSLLNISNLLFYGRREILLFHTRVRASRFTGNRSYIYRVLYELDVFYRGNLAPRYHLRNPTLAGKGNIAQMLNIILARADNPTLPWGRKYCSNANIILIETIFYLFSQKK